MFFKTILQNRFGKYSENLEQKGYNLNWLGKKIMLKYTELTRRYIS